MQILNAQTPQRLSPFISSSARQHSNLSVNSAKSASLQGIINQQPILGSRRYTFQSLCVNETFGFSKNLSCGNISKKSKSIIPRSSNSPESSTDSDSPTEKEKVPFGYSRKDVIFIGVGVTALGVGLKSGLETAMLKSLDQVALGLVKLINTDKLLDNYVGVDPLQAGNVVQLVLVLGLTIGWISTYIFRVSNKEMTYAQQLRDYESQVMQKRLDGLTEAELEALLEQVDEDKRRIASGKQVK